MMTTADFHRPVLAEEAVDYLVTNGDGVYIDATAGGGGHSIRIISRLGSAGRLVAIDRDEAAVQATRRRLVAVSSRVEVVREEFGRLMMWARQAGVTGVHGVLFDLGVSSHHLDNPERGFSYRFGGPLDLRMDSTGPVTAADIVNTWPLERLSKLFFEYGEERNSRAVARAIETTRRRQPLQTTTDLVDVVRKVTNPRFLNKTLSRLFQALRIEVNDELNQLQRGLEAAIELLFPGGRVVVISYHSLEDRLVKQTLRAQANLPRPKVRLITRRPVRPDPAEIAENPRARSAKLRAAEKC